MTDLLIGAHGPNRYWERRLTDSDKAAIARGRFRALVLMSYQSIEDFVWAADRGIDVICRLGNEGGWGQPQTFWSRHGETVGAFLPYCQKFILGNEPNVAVEGWTDTPDKWRAWSNATAYLFKAHYPTLMFASAPLSPSTANLQAWLDAEAAIATRDFLAVHAYWQGSPSECVDWLKAHTGRGVPVHVTEYNRVGAVDVGQYKAFLATCAQLGVSSASYFILSGTDDWRCYWLTDAQLDELAQLGGRLPLTGQPIKPAQPPIEEKPMATLQEQFPAAFAEWQKAGGVESNFATYLIGTGRLPANRANLTKVLDRFESAFNEVRALASRLPLA